MRTKTEQGKFGEKDRLILVKSEGHDSWEAISIPRILYLIRRLQINEKIIHEEEIKERGSNIFDEAVSDVLTGETFENIIKKYWPPGEKKKIALKKAREYDNNIKNDQLTAFCKERVI